MLRLIGSKDGVVRNEVDSISARVLLVVSLAVLLVQSAIASCPLPPLPVLGTPKLIVEHHLIGEVGESREVSHLPEVMERIAALEAGSLLEDSAPERIAVQVALMDAQALLEWLELRDAGAEVPEYEWKYMEQHPHRGIQREKVRAGLEAHPGDPHLVGLMAALQGFDSTFYRVQLESALARDPSLEHLREHLVACDSQANAPD